MKGNPFEVGKELYNENKGMGLGVVVDVDDDFVKTEDVAGQTRKRSRDQVETLFESSGMKARDTPDWFEL